LRPIVQAQLERIVGKLRRPISIERGVPAFSAELAELARVLRSLLDPYRPELHYMRGPGPKWRAKEAAAAASSSIPALLQAQA
jgi:hypothetical protein